MARDRLAAMRAQREGGSGQAPPGGQNNYEMSGLREQEHIAPPMNGGGYAPPAGGLGGFQEEIGSLNDMLRELDASVARIGQLHGQSLNTMDPALNQQHSGLLEEQVESTRGLVNQIKQRIAQLPKPTSGPEAQIQANQSALIRKKFKESLQNYQRVEKEYRDRYKQRVERQFKIVKPDATPEELSAVVNDTSGAGGQIFAQALTTSTRYSESRAAYREVQDRHQEILRIEQTMAELAQLINDVSILVQQGDEQIDNIQHTAEQVQTDMEHGVQQTEKAVVSARRARKLRWVCFSITMVIIIIIAIVLAVYFTQIAPKNNNK